MTRAKKRAAAAGIALAAAAATVSYASPAQAQTDDAATTAVVTVQAAITIAVDATFTLAGVPGDTASTTVSFTVTSNDPAGYTVTVQPVAADLLPPDPGTNPDTIPVTDVLVEAADGGLTPLDPDAPVAVHTQDTASAPEGDTNTHAYELTIPFVQSDDYTGEITYVATVNL